MLQVGFGLAAMKWSQIHTKGGIARHVHILHVADLDELRTRIERVYLDLVNGWLDSSAVAQINQSLHVEIADTNRADQSCAQTSQSETVHLEA